MDERNLHESGVIADGVSNDHWIKNRKKNDTNPFLRNSNPQTAHQQNIFVSFSVHWNL